MRDLALASVVHADEVGLADSRWWGLQDRLHAWLKELGPRRHAIHSGGWSVGRQAMAIYFRTLEDAQACVATFPEFELADGVGVVGHYAPGVEGNLTTND